MDKTEQEIWRFVQALNRTWTIEKQPQKLVTYFHRNMVALASNEQSRIEGQEACVASWKKFVDLVKIFSWKEIDPKIQIYGEGKFAIVTYYYELSCEMGGQTMNLSGRDMLSLVNEEDRWWVVSDQFSPYPQG